MTTAAIPPDWRWVRLKYVADLQTGITLGKDYGTKTTVRRPYLRVANVQDGYLDLETITDIAVPPDEASRCELRVGDVLMTEGGDFDKLGRGYIWTGQIPGCLHQNHVFAVRARTTQLEPRYLAAVIASHHGKAYFTSTSQQTTNLACTNSTKIRDFPIPLPPLELQRKILNNLDRETPRIDSLIAKKERLISLLEEKRAALINCAVTAGLDPTVPMKESGSPLFGPIPRHWQLKKLMYLIAPQRPVMYGIVLPGPNVAEGVPIVKGGDVAPGRLRLDLLNRTTWEIEAPYARSRLRGGDIVYAIRGSIGAAEMVPEALSGANLTQDAARVSPASGVNGQWLLFALRASSTFAQIDAGAMGATIRGVNIRDLKRVVLVVPPCEDQSRIVEYLSRVTAMLDNSVVKIREQIAKLQEYRTALISAAVTGKIDVTEEAATA